MVERDAERKLHIRLTQDMHRRLRIRCAELDVTIQDYVVRMLDQALAGLELIEQRLRRLWVEDDIRFGVSHDVGLERALDVGLIKPRVDLPEQILVTVDIGKHVLVVQVHQLRIKTACGEREEGVEEEKSSLGEVNRGVEVDLALLLKAHRASAMGCPHDVAEAVGLDEVTEIGVDDEPADDPVGLEVEAVEGPPLRLEPGADVLVGASFPGRHPVVDQGVVHVVADGAD